MNDEGSRGAAVSEEMLPSVAEARNGAVLIGVAQPPLLLAGPDGTGGNGSPATTENVVAEARRRFSLRAEDIREIASRKQAVLEEIVSLTKTRQLAEDGGSRIWDIYLAAEIDGHQVAMAAFRLDAASANLNGLDDFEPTTVEALADMKFPHGAIVVEHHPEIADPLMEVRHVAEALATREPEPGHTF